MSEKNIRSEMLDDGIVVLTFDKPNSSANTFNRATLEELDAALDQLAADPSAKGLVITSAKPTIFMAGADLVELSKLDAEGIREIGAFGQAVFQKLAQLRIPTAAAIHGACLGGGFEVALACDWRVASDDKATKLGLPETMLGILPAWGGSTRLPRLIGLPAALDAILGGKQLAPKKARKLGAVDALAPREHVVREAIKLLGRGRPKRKTHALVNNALAAAIIARQAKKTVMKKSGGHYPALPRALDVAVRGARGSIEASLRRELDALVELTGTEVCRQLVGIFFLQERAKGYEIPGAPKLGDDAQVERMAVVGAGVMGAGIAQWSAARGIHVILKDIGQEPLRSGLETIAGLIQPLVKRRKISKIEARDIMDRIAPTSRDVPMTTVDLVIEAAVERMDVKKKIFAGLAERSAPETILATNTSALSVSELAAATPGSERVVGIHFFNPVARMQLVEVVLAESTSPETAARALAYVQQIGKLPVVVKDAPGFVVNRVLTPYLCEAGLLFNAGVPIERIDRAMKRFGMPMGPLRLVDEVGGDVAMHVARHQAEHFPERVLIPEALTKMAEEGLLGRKSGAGFYVYPKKGKTEVNDAAKRFAKSTGGVAGSDEELASRMALLMVNEAARVLEEGLVEAPEDVDFAMIMGTGFAPFRGGPLRYADALGAAEVLRRLEALAAEHGARFAPADSIRKMAAEGRRFYASELPTAVTDAA